MINTIELIETGLFKLDGGAMFGVVPKRMWNKLNPADENNMCTWSLRCLLIRNGSRKILVDTGMGDKQDEKFRSFFLPHGEDTLFASLRNINVHPEEITDVFLTHLHFDHCGAAVSKTQDGKLYPSFPNANYWSNEIHWNWACQPNAREKASFLKENFIPLRDEGKLKFIDVQKDALEWLPGLKIHFCNGHTEALMALEIQTENETYFYPSDLIPSSHHVPSAYIMAYDVRPLLTLEEKEKYLHSVFESKGSLIFEHDPKISKGRINKSEDGRFSLL